VGIDHHNEDEVQAFMDAEEEALNEEERILMDGPDFDNALQNAYQQGLDANNPDVNIPDVSPSQSDHSGFLSPRSTQAAVGARTTLAAHFQ
jgi:hypothetical protein